MSCVVWGCKSHSSRKENSQEFLSFHRFPADDERKKEWEKVIGRQKWTSKKHSHICSRHFNINSFVCATNTKWRRLRENAIPTLNMDQTYTLDYVPMDLELAATQSNKPDLTGKTTANPKQDYAPMDLETLPSTSTQINKPDVTSKTTANPKLDYAPMVFVTVPRTSTQINKPNLTSKTTTNPQQDYAPMDLETLPSTSTQINKPDVTSKTTANPKLDYAPMVFVTAPSTSTQINKPDLTSKTTTNPQQNFLTPTRNTEEYKRKIQMLEKKLEQCKKVSKRRLRKINTLTKRVSRLGKKNTDLYTILMEKLKKENIETEYITMLDKINEDGVIKRFLSGVSSREYTTEVKKFAVTLNYLSPKAYNFVREHFKNTLPHPKTICTWYRSLDCSPGFTTEALNAIRSRVEQNPNKKLFCALALDEMAIRKIVEWDQHNNEYYGYVNVGCDLHSETVPLATQALMFMATCVNDTWKIPVGYFLIKSISAQQKAMLVTQCIQLLQECGVTVVTLTFDGAATNIAMCSYLGCNIFLDSVSFKCENSDIYIWPDPSHNIKLIRNTLGEKKVIIDGQNRIVSWDHIQRLLELQENEGLHLGNKLKRDHLLYIKQKMKVRLATQLFSNSVADALQYCKDKSIPGFNDCDGTITFLRVFNNLFDIFDLKFCILI